MPDMPERQQNEQELIKQFYPILCCIARRYLSENEAEEVVQETCTRFLSILRKGETIYKPHAFVRGILMRVIKEFKRQKQRYSSPLNLNQNDQIESYEVEYIAKEEISLVRKAFNELDPICQRLLFLNIVERKSYYSLESLLNKSRNALHHRAKKCLKKFEQLLKKYGIV